MGSLITCSDIASLYSLSRVLGPKYYNVTRIWARKPYYLGPWTLRARSLFLKPLDAAWHVEGSTSLVRLGAFGGEWAELVTEMIHAIWTDAMGLSLPKPRKVGKIMVQNL